ncbi:MAG: response regulator transcription factor [Bacteroidetes bacterium]|nr:response regulator transcription factor [Bacteroidota bacterium]
MKVLIIDNDSSIREGLVSLLKKLCPQITEIKEADGVAAGLKAIDDVKPEVVFLDVEMDDGTGFDLVQKLGSYNFQLIFITAHNKYAVNAFKFSAIDFLLKPIDPMDLVLSINKAISQKKNRDLEQQVKLLEESLQNINSLKIQDRKIALNDGNVIHYIKVNDIIYCQADGSYTVFHLMNSKKIMVSKLLKEYEDLFSDFSFLRTHHSYLINTSKISKFDKADGGQLIMEENHSVPVSARKKEQVLDILGKL